MIYRILNEPFPQQIVSLTLGDVGVISCLHIRSLFSSCDVNPPGLSQLSSGSSDRTPVSDRGVNQPTWLIIEQLWPSLLSKTLLGFTALISHLLFPLYWYLSLRCFQTRCRVAGGHGGEAPPASGSSVAWKRDHHLGLMGNDEVWRMRGNLLKTDSVQLNSMKSVLNPVLLP